MAGKVETICEEKINPIIEQLGYEVLEVEYIKKQDGMNLSFYIDGPNGIFIEDCEKVHRAIEDLLDEINPTDDTPYILNVCSPGIDRPIKNVRDFERNKNKQVEVKLFAPLDGKKIYKGELVDFNDQTVTIVENKKTLNIDRKKIAIIVPVINIG